MQFVEPEGIVKLIQIHNTNKKGLPFGGSLFYLYGALGRIRTFDRSVRSRVLYPAELRVRCFEARIIKITREAVKP